jgi:hypothetical protein
VALHYHLPPYETHRPASSRITDQLLYRSGKRGGIVARNQQSVHPGRDDIWDSPYLRPDDGPACRAGFNERHRGSFVSRAANDHIEIAVDGC